MNLYFLDLVQSSLFRPDKRRGKANLHSWGINPRRGDILIYKRYYIFESEYEYQPINNNVIPLPINDHEFHPEYWAVLIEKFLVQFSPIIIKRIKDGLKYSLFAGALFSRFRIGKKRYLLFHSQFYDPITEERTFTVHGSWTKRFGGKLFFDPRMDYCLLTIT
jgi:hypothetical protein